MKHISLGVTKTQSAGLQQVGRFNGGFGYRDTTYTQHLEEKTQNPILVFKYMFTPRLEVLIAK